MLALDLFCGAGGASMGLHLAGFDVVGVDINPQPNYPFQFIQDDALEFNINEFDFIWASPPCQAFTLAQRIRKRKHPNLIEPIRRRLKRWGGAYVIENVIGAPLINPTMLCGSMFQGLRVYRHRLFECNFPVIRPLTCVHIAKQTKMGRPAKPGEFMQIVGNWSGKAAGQKAMGINWMTRNEMSEAIPPAYARYIAENYLIHKAAI